MPIRADLRSGLSLHRPPRTPQSADDLHRHLEDHVGFLKASAEAYDAGQTGEAKRLAVSLRVLLHDTKASHSLLGQLGRLSSSFLSTAIPHDDANLLTHGGLVVIGMKGRDTRYLAMLDDVPYCRWLPSEGWWNEPVFVDDRREQLSRKQLILSVANQDGGAHVDPALNETYARLSRHNSLGWSVTEGSATYDIPNAERAAVRQIAHEVLKTLDPKYAKKPAHDVELLVGGGMVHQGVSVPPLPRPIRVERNDPCPCGSGKKFKKCHGAPRS